MDRREFLGWAVATPLVAATGASSWAQEARPAAAPFRVLDLSGSPRERGRAHGEELRDRTRDFSQRWRAALQVPKGWTTEQYLERFLRDNKFQPVARRLYPDILEEIEGIAEGAGLPFESVFAMQLIDEEWWYGQDLAATLAEGKGDKCTVVAAAGVEGAPSYVGQTLDIPSWTRGHEVLLRIRGPESDDSQLVLSLSGVVGANGATRRGFAVCVNTLLQLAHRRAGLPVAFVVRGVLEQPDLASAERFLRERPHASGQAYTLADRARVVSYEASADGVTQVTVPDGARCLAHTNHPLISEHWNEYGARWKRWQKQQTGGTNSELRLRAAERYLASETVPLVALRGALSSHEPRNNPICNHHSPESSGFSAAATIYEMGDAVRLHVAPNPPCTARWSTIEVD